MADMGAVEPAVALKTVAAARRAAAGQYGHGHLEAAAVPVMGVRLAGLAVEKCECAHLRGPLWMGEWTRTALQGALLIAAKAQLRQASARQAVAGQVVRCI